MITVDAVHLHQRVAGYSSIFVEKRKVVETWGDWKQISGDIFRRPVVFLNADDVPRFPFCDNASSDAVLVQTGRLRKQKEKALYKANKSRITPVPWFRAQFPFAARDETRCR
jgi:hypothetical protein